MKFIKQEGFDAKLNINCLVVSAERCPLPTRLLDSFKDFHDYRSCAVRIQRISVTLAKSSVYQGNFEHNLLNCSLGDLELSDTS